MYLLTFPTDRLRPIRGAAARPLPSPTHSGIPAHSRICDRRRECRFRGYYGLVQCVIRSHPIRRLPTHPQPSRLDTHHARRGSAGSPLYAPSDTYTYAYTPTWPIHFSGAIANPHGRVPRVPRGGRRGPHCAPRRPTPSCTDCSRAQSRRGARERNASARKAARGLPAICVCMGCGGGRGLAGGRRREASRGSVEEREA